MLNDSVPSKEKLRVSFRSMHAALAGSVPARMAAQEIEVRA
jgi:hypothetical protein